MVDVELLSWIAAHSDQFGTIVAPPFIIIVLGAYRDLLLQLVPILIEYLAYSNLGLNDHIMFRELLLSDDRVQDILMKLDALMYYADPQTRAYFNAITWGVFADHFINNPNIPYLPQIWIYADIRWIMFEPYSFYFEKTYIIPGDIPIPQKHIVLWLINRYKIYAFFYDPKKRYRGRAFSQYWFTMNFLIRRLMGKIEVFLLCL